MREEALAAPAAVARLLAVAAPYDALAAALRADPPRAVVTIARGSSDHAAAYLGYLLMAELGCLVTSLPMSLVTLQPTRIEATGLLAVALSQSGRSPDLVLPTRTFRDHGGRTACLVNDTTSPLAQAAEWVLPLAAGREGSVAATKSFICQLAASARLLAAWRDDAALAQALDALPAALTAAAGLDWSRALEVLQGAERLFVIGRGTGLPVALEAALKLKETCAIQAEAFSAAEVRHGPMALVDADYPLLVLAPRGPAQESLLALAREMRGRSRKVLLAAPAGVADAELPLLETASALLDPIAAIQSFYPFAEALARARGRDPDRPPHLAKVTLTQ